MSHILEIENLSKRYWVFPEQIALNSSLKEFLSQSFKDLYHTICRKTKKQKNLPQEFWALQNIDLHIEAGDRLALLGRNGAGKSTFLKLLSRITEPTTGSIKSKGRISSLLEVGTGFHPELTGRENIFLSGVIMGMNYQEMKGKLEAIVAFADIAQFLDVPVKRYSSGMFMRLGFAIAVHVPAEILIVDEVLAVGDKNFQKKCLEKLNELSLQGKTILFVSHQVEAIRYLCNKGLFLEQGRVKTFGPIQECLTHYMQSSTRNQSCIQVDKLEDEYMRFLQIALRPISQTTVYSTQEVIYLDIFCEVLTPHPDILLNLSIYTQNKQLIIFSQLQDHVKYKELFRQKGKYQLSFRLDLKLFHAGEYKIHIDCFTPCDKKLLINGLSLPLFIEHPERENWLWSKEKSALSLGNQWLVE